MRRIPSLFVALFHSAAADPSVKSLTSLRHAHELCYAPPAPAPPPQADIDEAEAIAMAMAGLAAS